MSEQRLGIYRYEIVNRMKMQIAVHQLSSLTDPAQNCAVMAAAIARAGVNGAAIYFAPEMALLLDRNRNRAAPYIVEEPANLHIQLVQAAAKAAGIWVHLGSVAVRLPDDRDANRTLLIDSDGVIRARYDKMHLFDVDLATGESWRESSTYKAGEKAVAVDTPAGRMGLTICYDLRFPDLFSRLTRGGATIFAVPSAFTVPTGEAHWHVMLRARAIESAAFVVAAAQVGTHEDGRQTYGHSLVVDPWGTVLLDMGVEPGLGFVDLDLGRIDEVRAQVPVHINRRDVPPL
jgi:deaminated glutathione amidase